MKKILAELKLIFRNPRDIHRVVMITPLGAMLSHGIYLAMKTSPLPFTSDEIMSIVLAVTLYSMITLWTIFSNELHFRIVSRFAFMAGYGALAHRLILGISNVGGVSVYESVFFLTTSSVVAFFVATGFTVTEIKDIYNGVGSAKKITGANVVSIPERNESAS